MCKCFCYKEYTFDEKTGVLSLIYSYQHHKFVEEIIFPNAPFHLNHQTKQALDRIFFLTHIAFGISYYKAFCPTDIEIQSGYLTKQESLFFETFYLNGLGEFAIKNNLNLQNKIHFPYQKDQQIKPITLELKKRFFVPIGGGKDSCVTLEFFKHFNYQATPISINPQKPIFDCIDKSNLRPLFLKRKIAPTLIELNQTGSVLNGHVPITGMLAFLLWISALIYDYQYVALSCEKSANSGNMTQGDLIINHQYSKSFSFEKDFYQLTQTITPTFLYFSLLRPLSEYHIAKLFSKYGNCYFDCFTSCNKAFRLNDKTRFTHWCADCDKCRFVFLILAPFLDKETLIKAVGDNLLDNKNQLKGYEELLGLSGHKPFECVGEIKECQYALLTLAQSDKWKNDFIVKELSQKLPPLNFNPFQLSDKHLLPEEIQNDFRLFIA